MQKLKVNIYGDSIMRATVMDESKRYRSTISPIFAELGQKYDIEFNNRSRFGNTVGNGAEILRKDLEKGLDCDYALVEYGGNDCNFIWDEVADAPEAEHQPLTGTEKFREVITDMVMKLKAASVTPILMTLPPIDSVKYLHFIGKNERGRRNILQWLGDVHMIYRFHELYSRIVEQVAISTNTILVDIRRRYLDKHNFYDMIGDDGIHMSEKGYRLCADAFSDFIRAHRKDPGKLLYT